MVPKPCAGVILLFPCTDNIYKLRARQKQLLLQNPDSPAQTAAYHVQQIAEFGNAWYVAGKGAFFSVLRRTMNISLYISQFFLFLVPHPTAVRLPRYMP